MTPKEVRQHVTEIDIDATPDQVFRAVTEADQIVRWFAPQAKVEPGSDGNMVGGSYHVSWGPGAEGTSKIAIWEPGRRFATEEHRSTAFGREGKPEETAEVQRIMVDYQIEAAGGRTHLRLVHSGFGRGAGWDNEFEGTRTGWPIFMLILKHGLEHHPGVDSVTASAIVPSSVTPGEAWRRLIGSPRLDPGDRYSIPFAALQGTVIRYDPLEAFIGRVDALNDALVGIYCGFQGDNVNVSVVLWGKSREQAKQIESTWTELLRTTLA